MKFIYGFIIINSFINICKTFKKKTKSVNEFYKVKISRKNSILFKNFTNNYKNYVEKGLCSYYHNMFNGNKTSTGDIFYNNRWTCAHRTLPLPSIILVTFIHNKKIKGIKLLVNDRGPFIKNRIIDISRKVAEEIGIIKIGIIKVVIFLLEKDTKNMLKTGVFKPIPKLLNIKEINKVLKENNYKS